MTLPPFNQQFLDGAKPDGIEALLLQLQQDLDATKKRVLQLENIGQASQLTGSLNVSGDGQVTAGGMLLAENGAELTNGPSDLTVNFWASLGVPSNGGTCIVYAIAAIGTAIYVGGSFSKIGGIAANNIAKYETTTGVWSALGTGLNDQCKALAVIGTDLYIGGLFTLAGGVTNTKRIAKWDGSAFSALSTGLQLQCWSLAVIGTNLYMGGNFANAGGVANTSGIAKWDGSAYSALGTGLGGGDTCYALGTDGTNLYLGGNFTSVGGVANTAYIAKWDGSAYSALGTGLNNTCNAIATYGTDVYMCGGFTLAGGVADTVRIAKWDGSAYSALGTGLNGVSCYELYFVGTDLYIGGDFTLAGGIANTVYIAKWDGSTYSALGTGLSGGYCYAITSIGSDLYIGGAFTGAGGRASLAVAGYLQTLQSVLAYLEITEQALQDAIVTDVTLYNASTLMHGLLKKLSGLSTDYMGGDGNWNATTTLAPTGQVSAYAGRSAPTGWLICDGSAISRATYPSLASAIMPSLGTVTMTSASPAVFTLAGHNLKTADAVYLTTTGALYTGLAANTLYYVIKIDANTFNLADTRAHARAGTNKINTSGSQSGTHTLTFCPFGLGDGSTTFNVPDMRHAVAGGVDTSDANFDVLGLAGGEETHALTVGEMPAHTHNVLGRDNSTAGTAVREMNASSSGTVNDTNLTSSTGSGTAHNNLQPYLVLNFIIKT